MTSKHDVATMYFVHLINHTFVAYVVTEYTNTRPALYCNADALPIPAFNLVIYNIKHLTKADMCMVLAKMSLSFRKAYNMRLVC